MKATERKSTDGGQTKAVSIILSRVCCTLLSWKARIFSPEVKRPSVGQMVVLTWYLMIPWSIYWGLGMKLQLWYGLGPLLAYALAMILTVLWAGFTLHPWLRRQIAMAVWPNRR